MSKPYEEMSLTELQAEKDSFRGVDGHGKYAPLARLNAEIDRRTERGSAATCTNVIRDGRWETLGPNKTIRRA